MSRPNTHLRPLCYSDSGPVNEKKAAAFELFDELVRKAEYAFSTKHEEHRESPSNIEGDILWDTFMAVTKVDNAPYPVTFKIRTIDADARSQIYDIATKNEIGFDRGDCSQNAMADAHPSYATSPISKGNVSQKDTEVKQGFPIDDDTAQNTRDGEVCQDWHTSSSVRLPRNDRINRKHARNREDKV